MTLFRSLKKPDINQGLIAFKKNKKAVLLDVRTQEEYKIKHIDGSLNIPVQSLEKIIFEVKNLSTPIYVYCHSGTRSATAVSRLRKMGYSDVTDIGGITDYNGN